MSETINAKGLACPQPVILAKKALERNDSVLVLVDNRAAVENVTRLGESSGCAVEVKEDSSGVFSIRLEKRSGARVPEDFTAACSAEEASGAKVAGPTVFVIASNAMGQGDDDLGMLLMKAFVHTTTELDRRPDVMIFYNTGVKLAAKDSDVVDDLKALEAKDVRILVCGTCANYFKLGDSLGAGVISNMYDIASILGGAGRIVRP